ncbi:MAG: thioredoxin family protein [Actinomycetia bacterium]|nr:thioredoxin family protein [Actinomycetes bacterium]
MAMHSHMVPLGTPLPDVTLPDLAGQPVRLIDYAAGEPLVVIFLANHCPYVRHIEHRLAQVFDAFEGTGVRFIAISSNDVTTHPDDDAAGLASQIERTGWRFPYLMDEDQTAAKAFHAACTPDFFVFDAQGQLAYRGSFDASTPKNGNPVNGKHLRDAVTKVLLDKPVPEPQPPSMGCGIKWKPGNEPEAITFV